MLDPPPTATNASHGPCARAQSIAACILASVGSTWTPSKTAASTPNWAICAATRSGSPVAATPWRVGGRAEVVQDLAPRALDAGTDEAGLAHEGQHALGVAVDGEPREPAERGRDAAGQTGHRAEVDDAQPTVGQHPEVAGVRV